MMLSCCLCQSIPIYYKKECNRGHNTYLEIFSVHLSQAKLEHFSCESEVGQEQEQEQEQKQEQEPGNKAIAVSVFICTTQQNLQINPFFSL